RSAFPDLLCDRLSSSEIRWTNVQAISASNTNMIVLSKTLEQLGHGHLTDGEIVKRVLAGDSGLFELLIRRHDQRVYRAARAIVRNEADAEDITQETYLHAFQHLSQFEHRAKFSTWLLRIAIHAALARHRGNAR